MLNQRGAFVKCESVVWRLTNWRTIAMLCEVILGTMMVANVFPSRRSGSTERQIFGRQVQIILQHRDYQVVIVTLRQPGNGDCAHASRARENDREAAAVRRIVFWIEPRFRLQSGLSALMRQANGVGTAMIALDNVAFAANPVRVVRSSSRHGVCK